MFQALRRNLAIVGAGLTLAFVPVAVPAVALAATVAPPAGAGSDPIQDPLKCGSTLDLGSSTTGTPSNCQTNVGTGADKVNTMIKLIVNIFSAIVGVVSVIMIIFGGFKYVTSGGDSGNVTGAKNTIIYAVIGLVVVALAQFIVQFMLSKVTGEVPAV